MRPQHPSGLDKGFKLQTEGVTWSKQCVGQTDRSVVSGGLAGGGRSRDRET